MPPFEDLFGLTAEELLSDQERAQFFAFEPEFARSPKQRDFFRGFFPTFFDTFQGERARSLLEGRVPTETVAERTQRFPFLEEFLSRSPRARGDQPTRLAPRTRFNFARR
jgi:hypothetical protein